MAVNIIWRVFEETPCSAPSRTSCFGWSTGHHGFTQKLIDAAYDVADTIDLLMLKSARQGRRRGILEGFILFICDFIDQYQLHKKLGWIKVKIPALPTPVLRPHAQSHFADIEEINWRFSSSVKDQNIANTGVSLVMEKEPAMEKEDRIIFILN